MSNENGSAWPIALAATLLIQIAVSFLSQAMSVLAPSITQAANVAPDQIGWLAALTAVGTLWFLMGGSRLLADMGPVRLLQVGVLISSLALLLAVGGWWPATCLAALLVGWGYGPAPPAGNQLLMNTVPQKHRGLIFSIKQSGAPLGSAFAGFLLPVIATSFGWAWALAVASILAAVTALLVEPFRKRLDGVTPKIELAAIRSFFSLNMIAVPFKAMQGATGLAHLAYTGFALAIVQGSVFAMYVTYLVTTVGADLEAAGRAFAVMQIAGVVARVVMGWIADRLRRPLITIATTAVGSSVIILAIAMMQLGWGWGLIFGTSALAGVCAASWNGVLMSEIAKASPAGQVGQTTSAATFFIFIGYVVGPASFAAIIRATGSYQAGFTFLALFPLTGSLVLYLRMRQPAKAKDRGLA